MNVAGSLSPKLDPKPLALPTSQQILELIPHPVLIVETDGVVVYANGVSKDAIGALDGLDLYELFPGFTSNLTSMTNTALAVLTSKDGEHFEAAFSAFDGERFLINLRPRFHAPIVDIAGDHDELTGLAKRNALLSHVSAALALAPSMVAVHCLDLDRFKMVNDRRASST